ncbi:MAG TPA: oligosaccharide flippase family protein, partial [Anaerolineae bacterium]
SYGDVVAIAAFYGWFTLLASYTTHALLPRMVADPDLSQASKSRACATTFWTSLVFTLLATIPAMLLLPLGLRQFDEPTLRTATLVYGVVFALGQVNAVLLAISQSAGWMRQWSAVGLLGGALPVISLLVYQMVQGPLTPFIYLVLLALSSFITIGFSFALFLRGIGGLRHLRPDVKLIRPMLDAGRGPWLATFSNVIVSFGTNTLIAAHLKTSDLGHYDVILSLHTWVTTIGLAVTIPAMADWSRNLSVRDFNAIRVDFRLRQTSTAVVLGMAAVFTFIFAEPILYALYGPDFSSAAPVLRILVTSWFISGLGGWYWYFMFASGNAWRVAPPNLAFGIPCYMLTFVLLTFTSTGLPGVVTARVLGLLLWLIVYEVHFRRVLRLNQLGKQAQQR